jgi:hypothetical protein
MPKSATVPATRSEYFMLRCWEFTNGSLSGRSLQVKGRAIGHELVEGEIPPPRPRAGDASRDGRGPITRVDQSRESVDQVSIFGKK